MFSVSLHDIFKIFVNYIFVHNLIYPSQNSDNSPNVTKLRVDKCKVFGNYATIKVKSLRALPPKQLYAFWASCK